MILEHIGNHGNLNEYIPQIIVIAIEANALSG